jgi:hypothetical protein
MRDETQGSKPLGFIEKGSPWMENFQTHPSGQTRPRRLGESSGAGPRTTASRKASQRTAPRPTGRSTRHCYCAKFATVHKLGDFSDPTTNWDILFAVTEFLGTGS